MEENCNARFALRQPLLQVGYLDFRKSLDSANHRLLDRKAKAFGVVAQATKLPAQCKKGGSFRAKFKWPPSDVRLLYSGVPQKPVFRPRLFLLCEHDITKVLEIRVLFAEDANY